MARCVGILGGTFDPVHIGHLVLAMCARDQLSTDELVFIPNARSPLKSVQPEAPFADRLEMLKLAIGEVPGFTVSDIEGRRGGISYTIDTLLSLRRDHPGDVLYLILGSDTLRDLPSWHEAERVLELARVAVVARHGDKQPIAEPVTEAIVMPRLDVSASQVRDRIRDGRSIDFLTPAPVVAYIHEHSLYRNS